jgi:hypothetical protein
MSTQELAQELGRPDARMVLHGSAAWLAYNDTVACRGIIFMGFCWNDDRIVSPGRVFLRHK